MRPRSAAARPGFRAGALHGDIRASSYEQAPQPPPPVAVVPHRPRLLGLSFPACPKTLARQRQNRPGRREVHQAQALKLKQPGEDRLRVEADPIRSRPAPGENNRAAVQSRARRERPPRSDMSSGAPIELHFAFVMQWTSYTVYLVRPKGASNLLDLCTSFVTIRSRVCRLSDLSGVLPALFFFAFSVF
ncbi:hypothetical protein CGRA01v4_02199 [Colletotrichum graminicola]|nr:hypothetical protein CGRA01v4_02199 [Colletotrichum graminicola]